MRGCRVQVRNVYKFNYRALSMTQRHQKETILQPKLCIKCTEMYGNPSFEDMCSLCFKKEKAEQKLQELKRLEPEPKSPQPSPTPQIKVPFSDPESRKREAPASSPSKSPAGRCLKCNKKTSILGYNCKHCSRQFCKFHRLPEDHDCGVDFIALGRKQIKTDNPIISHSKIQQI